MARTNLSLGNLYRAVSGSVRTGTVSLGGLAGQGAGSNVGMMSFATDAITVTPPTYTYIVESTTENAQFSFSTTGSRFNSKVQSQENNYTCSFSNANFSIGTRTTNTGPTIFPVTPAAINASNYSEASSVLTMKYEDGYNINATGYGEGTIKTLYAVDVYNTINEPDFCLLFGTKITKADGTEINVEDLIVGDEIKAWVPDGLPDEDLPIETDNVDWRFFYSDNINGSIQNVIVKDLTFNFAEGYFSINNGLINATETHPLYVWCNEIQKYRFKNVADILPDDKLVMQDESEVLVTNIELVRNDVEIVTINVENADVYISNGLISHNKGTTTQPFIPSSGLRMYMDPSKAYSFPSQTLPPSGETTPATDWLDLGGYNTGVRPAGVPNSAGYTGNSPSYSNSGTRATRYWSLTGSEYWFKDRNSNINGGITQFDVTAMTFLAWVNLPSNPGQTYGCLFSKSGADRDYNFYFYSSNASVWDGFHFSSARGTCSNTVQTFTAPALNAWHLVGFTISAAAGITYYLNGVSVGTGTMSAFTATNTYDIKLGRDDNYAKCHLGPVLFYNRVLSSTEVDQVYDYFQPTYRP